nr:RNA-dependent RNA polymerase [Saccharomyces cerevisiae YJM1199 virus N1199]
MPSSDNTVLTVPGGVTAKMDVRRGTVPAAIGSEAAHTPEPTCARGNRRARVGLRGRVQESPSSSSQRLDMLLSAWAATVAATTKERVDTRVRSRKNPTPATSWYRDGEKWIRKVSRHSGIEAALALCKEFAGSARSAWIFNKPFFHHRLMKKAPLRIRRSANAWAQLSYLGRALPRGGSLAVSRALRVHYDCLTSTFHSRPDDLSSLEEWTVLWARRYLDRHPSIAQTCSVPTSGSACYEVSRKDGGFDLAVSGLLQESSELDLERPDGVSDSVWTPRVAELRLLNVSLSKAREDREASRPPRGRVVALPERGFKVRVVTAMQAHNLVLGHTARRRLMKGMRRWPMLRETLAGNESTVVQELVGGAGEVVSSDLKSASDLIPFDVVEAILRGLARSGRLDPVELEGLRVCTGPQHLSWPDGREAVTSRGILMGLPTTWALLNLYHGWCWQVAIDHAREYSLPSGHPVRAIGRICGDDLIGTAPRHLVDCYEQRLRGTGAVLSDGKHFRSSNRGVFLEVLWELRGKRFTVYDGGVPIVRKSRGRCGRRVTRPVNQVALHHWEVALKCETFPIKSLVVGDPNLAVPEYWGVSTTEDALLGSYDVRTVSAVARTVRPDLPSKFRAAGIPPHLPRSLGGAGLARWPPNPSETVDASRSHRKALATALYGVGDYVSATAFGQCWRDGEPSPWREMATQDVRFWIDQVSVVAPSGTVPAVGMVSLGDPARALQSLIGTQSQQYVAMLGPDLSARKYPSLRRLAASMRRVRASLRNRWKSANPVRKPLSELLLRQRSLSQGFELWVSEYTGGSLDSPPGEAYQTAYLSCRPHDSTLHSWRQFAIASLSRLDQETDLGRLLGFTLDTSVP